MKGGDGAMVQWCNTTRGTESLQGMSPDIKLKINIELFSFVITKTAPVILYGTMLRPKSSVVFDR